MVIIAATLFVYWPAQRNGFVWDDTALVQRDPLIRSWRLIPEGFRHFLFIDATASNFYRPLQRLSFTLDYALWDRSTAGWHLTSIYVHLAAAIALFFLAEKMLASRAWACAIALLWAVHPLHTSAVTYIAGRADPLQAMFGFTALLLGLVSLDGGKRARLAMLGAAVFFLCALLSKEAGFSALLIWFVMLAWRRESRAVWTRWLGIGALVIAAYGALRFSADSTAPPHEDAPPIAVRPILAARALAEYAGLILAPVNLRMERDVSSGVGRPQERREIGQRREWQTLLGLALIAACAVWWRWTKRAAPIAALALTAAFTAYLPVSNLFPLNASVAEHWLYVPLAFLFIAAAATFRELRFTGKSPAREILAICALAWCAWLGARTWRRQADWRDQRTFLERNIAAGGDSARMRVNLGQLASAAGRDDLALDQFRAALERAPDQPFAQFGAAAVLIRLSQYDDAEPLLAKAESHPFFATDCRLLRASMQRLKSGADILPEIRAVAESTPRNWPVWRRYADELARADRRADAIRELRAFLDRESFRAESWAMLGDLLAKEHDYANAIAAFTEATKLDVHDVESAKNIAIARRVMDAH